MCAAAPAAEEVSSTIHNLAAEDADVFDEELSDDEEDVDDNELDALEASLAEATVK